MDMGERQLTMFAHLCFLAHSFSLPSCHNALKECNAMDYTLGVVKKAQEYMYTSIYRMVFPSSKVLNSNSALHNIL